MAQDEPRWENSCPNCKFLTHHGESDLYFCEDHYAGDVHFSCKWIKRVFRERRTGINAIGSVRWGAYFRNCPSIGKDSQPLREFLFLGLNIAMETGHISKTEVDGIITPETT